MLYYIVIIIIIIIITWCFFLIKKRTISANRTWILYDRWEERNLQNTLCYKIHLNKWMWWLDIMFTFLVPYITGFINLTIVEYAWHCFPAVIFFFCRNMSLSIITLNFGLLHFHSYAFQHGRCSWRDYAGRLWRALVGTCRSRWNVAASSGSSTRA